MKHFLDATVIVLMAIAGLTHIMRIIYLVFGIKLLEKIDFIANSQPGKSQLFFYYVLTIGACLYGINLRLG